MLINQRFVDRINIGSQFTVLRRNGSGSFVVSLWCWLAAFALTAMPFGMRYTVEPPKAPS